jgi:hypothetical protein
MVAAPTQHICPQSVRWSRSQQLRFPIATNVTRPLHDVLPAACLLLVLSLLYRNLRGSHTVWHPPSSNGLAVTVWHNQGVWLFSAPVTRGSPSDPCCWGSSGSCGCVLKLQLMIFHPRRGEGDVVAVVHDCGWSHRDYGPPTRPKPSCACWDQSYMLQCVS